MKKYIVLIFVIINFLFAVDFKDSISSSPNRINPLLATDSASGEIVQWIFNGLVKFDKNAKIVPDLAKEWHFENNTTLIFKLRKNVLWHDGEKFDANDVKFTYDLLMSKKLTTPYSSEFKEVKSVELLDNFTLKVEYKKPYFKALSIWMMGVLPKHIWKNEQNPMQSNYNKFAIGTGAFKMTKPYEVNKNIELIANSNYYVHKPKIDKIIYKYVGDSSTGFLLLKSKKLDLGGLTPLQISRQIDEDFKKDFNIYERASNSYTYMGLNLRKKPFNNPKVREALKLAIDKQELIDLLFFSHGKPCYGPFMPDLDVYPKDFVPQKYNLQRAIKLLNEAGYNKNNPLEFTLVTNTGNDIRINAAEIIQHQLLKAGIKMKIRVLEWQAFLNTVVFPREFDAVLLGWSLGLIPDAYSIWHSDGDKKGGFNFVGYHNAEVDRLIIEAKSKINPKEFAAIYRKIFKLIAKDNPYIFLYIPNSITAVSKKIKNIKPSIIGIRHNFIDWEY